MVNWFFPPTAYAKCTPASFFNIGNKTILKYPCIIHICVLSPLSFITYIDRISKKAKARNENNINELLFADDQALITSTAKELQQLPMSMNEECKTNNM